MVLAAALALGSAASPAAAQSKGQTQGNGQNAQSPSELSALTQSTPTQPAATQAPITGTFCIEEMTATFCNVVTGPNTNGYGGSSVAAPGSSSAGTGGTVGSISASGTGSGAGGNTSSVPPCPSEPPFDEMCN
jgi:hypothetical protein